MKFEAPTETDRKLSARTRRQRFSSFSGMMDWAVVNEVIGRNPCKKIKHAGIPENDVADWMGHSSADVLREHYHYIFEGAEQRGRAAIASILTPGADDPTAGQTEVA
ncbi:hypothetical protein ACIBRY_34700 [Streptomyces anulatus]